MKTIDNGSNLDEIIFENRNKEYGAYSLRKNYKRNVVIALCVTLGFLSMSVGTPFILTYMSPEVIVTPGGDEPRIIEIMKPPKDEPIQRIEPPKIHLPKNNLETQVGFNPVVTDRKEDYPDTPIPITNTENPGNSSNDNDTAGLTAYTEPPVIDNLDDPPIIFKPFELSEQPDFVGGFEAMKKYIADKIKYPQEAKEMNIQGTVFVEFIVSPVGEITNVKVLKSVDPLLDNEATRVIKSMPVWTPGKQSGYPVNVSMVLPIVFKLY